mgnify:CR=1 FL=1
MAVPQLRSELINITIETELEEDGRWIAEVPELPGVSAYGTTKDEFAAKAEALALRVLAEQLRRGEAPPQPISIKIAAA